MTHTYRHTLLSLLTFSLSVPGLVAAERETPRERVSLDVGWRFHQGDPSDVTDNVRNYPEMPNLRKLAADQVTGEKSEAHMEKLRPDIFATRAGEDVSFVKPGFDDKAWRAVNVPHDWAVELPFDPGADFDHGFKALGDPKFGANNIGWYRRSFTLPAADAGKKFYLELDGVYRNCLVWVNGRIVGRNVSGYIGDHFDITPHLKPGGTNVLAIRVDASQFEGWFYEGAGIYRHVWLTKVNPVHVAQWGTFVHTTSLSGNDAKVTIQTEVTNQDKAATSNATLVSTIYDAEGKAVANSSSPINVAAGQTVTAKQEVSFKANLWSPKTPYLYKLVTTVRNGSAISDTYHTPFGVRTVEMDADKGVILNGKPIEILGMCNHQDHAGVGVALPDRIQYFRLERLMQMGVNAYRCSHNAPTAELLDACDQLGMLVMDENRRIGTDAESMSQLTRMIRRDRNHPSVFIWSLGNEEIGVQGTPVGTEIVKVMQDKVHSMDPTRRCTIAMNNNWGSGFSPAIDVMGFNYRLPEMDGYHAKFPKQPTIGTETDSHVGDRGIYANDPQKGYVQDNGVKHKDVGWGEPGEVWWPMFNERPWSSGGFGWTGFDYRGEPTPYYKNFVNTGSHFGDIDQCGFPKNSFYYYQANWSMKPVLHLFPHWNWEKPGDLINVRAYGNCREVELFLNGKSLGRKALNPRKHLEWNVPYAPGTLKAVGYDAFGEPSVSDTVATTGEPAGIKLTADRATIQADGKDVSMVTVAVADAKGNLVPTASNDITFAVKGGEIIGVGNGDPSSHEEDKANHRKLFSGLAQVIVQSGPQAGPITLTATASGLKSTEITINSIDSASPPAAPTNVSAVAGNGSVRVSWDIAPGAITYNVLRSETAGGPYTTVAANVSGIGLGHSDHTVVNGKKYFYSVSANGNGTSPLSAAVAAQPVARVGKANASVSERQVRISWEGKPGERYNLKRADKSGGPYKTIAQGLTIAAYSDSSVLPGRGYFYVVTLADTGGESPNSPEVAAKVPGPLPSQFTSAKIGSGESGGAFFSEGQFTISSAGANIWDKADSFQYVYSNASAPDKCDIRVRVAGMQSGHKSSKAGLMIRESLDPGSRHATVNVTAGAGLEFLSRTNAGDTTAGTTVGGQAAPCWLRLTRDKDVFTAYWSPDGEIWNQIGGPATIRMPDKKAYVGLAVCSQSGAGTSTAVFENLTSAPLVKPTEN